MYKSSIIALFMPSESKNCQMKDLFFSRFSLVGNNTKIYEAAPPGQAQPKNSFVIVRCHQTSEA